MFVSERAWDDMVERLRELERQHASLTATHNALVKQVIERGLRDEKETVVTEASTALPQAIAHALGQWPEGSAPYVANLQYAHAQLAIRPDDAEAIASEIKQGEDVEAWV